MSDFLLHCVSLFLSGSFFWDIVSCTGSPSCPIAFGLPPRRRPSASLCFLLLEAVYACDANIRSTRLSPDPERERLGETWGDEDGERVGVSTTSSPTAAWSGMGNSLLLPLPPWPLPPWPRPPATAGVFFVVFTDIAFPLLVGILNISGVSRLFSTSIWRQARHAVALYRHSHLTAAVRWLCVERELHARCMREPCAGHARFMRGPFAQRARNTLCTRLLFLTRALCMRYACALHTDSAPATRCACVVNSLASSEFWQKFDAQRRTGHIFHFPMRGPCVALVWLGL